MEFTCIFQSIVLSLGTNARATGLTLHRGRAHGVNAQKPELREKTDPKQSGSSRSDVRGGCHIWRRTSRTWPNASPDHYETHSASQWPWVALRLSPELAKDDLLPEMMLLGREGKSKTYEIVREVKSRIAFCWIFEAGTIPENARGNV